MARYKRQTIEMENIHIQTLYSRDSPSDVPMNGMQKSHFYHSLLKHKYAYTKFTFETDTRKGLQAVHT